jgi:hypothetical protein
MIGRRFSVVTPGSGSLGLSTGIGAVPVVSSAVGGASVDASAGGAAVGACSGCSIVSVMLGFLAPCEGLRGPGAAAAWRLDAVPGA